MLNILKCTQYTITLSIRSFAKKPLPLVDMKYLNVAEKNEAAKTIAGLLSKGAAQRREGYSVYNKIYEFEAAVNGQQSKMVMTSVSGHLLELEFLPSYRNWRNVDPQALFDAPVRKTCKEDYQPIKRTLEREIRGCNGLIIWTDCDREGENIGMEIIDVCRAIKPNLTIYRAVFSEITAIAVRRALQQLKSIDKRSSDAVNVRSELDLRTGAAITRFQTMRLQRLFPQNIADKLISYGSCQIPTLGFVAERYKEIEAFVSEPFWKIKVLHTIDDLTVEFNWARHRLFNQEECENYYLICISDPKATVESVTIKPKSKWRPQPMDTVEMEKLASRKLKLAAKDTMTIAEKLYTKGFISYPRTETNQFSKEFDLRALVEHQISHSVWGEFAQRVMEWGPNPRNGNKSDQAHPPIHPTKLITNLEGNEARVYELICRHFLACVSKDAVGMETIVHINIAGEKFTATGLCIHERNYLDVYIYDKWNAKQIHRYEEGQQFEPTDISMPEGATTAPPMLTEADLIALMEKHGIGTDATHAEHINTIKERGYIGVIDKGFLIPGVIGMALYEGYNAIELELAKPVLRATFEADLKKICLGEKDPQEVLREQITKYKEAYKHIMDHVTAMDNQISQRFNETPLGNDEQGNHNIENNSARLQEIFKCPKCQVANLALKQKKNQAGYYIGCLNFPDCKNAIWLPDECKEPQVLDETCSKCGNNTIKLLKFKFDSAFYKTEFNAPYGWYKTCLHCDSHFRNAFNINLDCVKRTGAIIDQGPQNQTSRTFPNNNHNNTAAFGGTGNNGTTTTTSSRSNNNNSSARTNNKTKTTSTNNPPAPKKPKTTTTVTKKTKTTTETTRVNFASTSSNIRNFFNAATTRFAGATTNETERIASQTVVNDFFDTNDSFDDNDFLTVEANMIASSTNSATGGRGADSNDNLPSTTSTMNVADLEEVFANDYFDNADVGDEDFANISWGTGNLSNRDNLNSHNNNINNNHNNNNNNVNTNNYENNNIDLDASWGRSSNNNTNRILTTANNSQISQSIENNSDWPNRVQSSNEISDHNVKCTGCYTLAKRLIVRKEGANKGRPFYSCSKSNPCKFFQWADEEQPTTSANSRETMTIPKTNNSNTQAIPNQHNNATQQNCNCGTEAKSLTVRKEGANKGRKFYACSNRDKNCGYFQWADDTQGATSSSSMAANESWGTSTNARSTTTNTITAVTNSRESKKRKCGLCRQEGHTRSKCPRSAQFQF